MSEIFKGRLYAMARETKVNCPDECKEWLFYCVDGKVHVVVEIGRIAQIPLPVTPKEHIPPKPCDGTCRVLWEIRPDPRTKSEVLEILKGTSPA